MLPRGFVAREVARTGQSVGQREPIGGTCFPTAARPSRRRRRLDLRLQQRGPRAAAASARSGSIATANIVDAYRILRRHAPQLRGRRDAVGHLADLRGVRRAAASGSATRCGASSHGAARARHVRARGRRRRPDHRLRLPDRGRARRALLPLHADAAAGDLSRGQLEVAGVDGTARSPGARVPRPDPPTAADADRCQVAASTPFNGGEGIVYDAGTSTSPPRATTACGPTTRATQTLERALRRQPSIRHASSPASTTSRRPPAATSSWPRTAATWSSCIITPERRRRPAAAPHGPGRLGDHRPRLRSAGTRLYFSSQRGARSAASPTRSADRSAPS